MSRAVIFRLSEHQKKQLLAARDHRELAQMVEDIEEAWDSANLLELDKSWDAIERCLEAMGQGQPFSHGQQLSGNPNMIASLLSTKALRSILEGIQTVTEGQFRDAFQAMSGYEGPGDRDDLEYSWSYFRELVAFYTQSAEQNRDTLFSVNL